MDRYIACELAYKNGYEAGYNAGIKKAQETIENILRTQSTAIPEIILNSLTKVLGDNK